MAELDPVLMALARQQPIGRLRNREDSPREIVTAVFSRLHARDQIVIHRLCALDPQPELQAWLRVVVRRSAIDYMRASPEFERATPTRPNRWISLATLSSGEPAAGADSLVEKRNQVLASLREMVETAATESAVRGDDAFGHLALEWGLERIHVRRLVTRGPQYLAVLTAVLAGHSHTDVAASLGMTRREVELTLGYIEELLRARFATE
jgi:DNA-directed RNA polymerase specialized sigma24 family protein